jgi:amidophosphoribosyltransferase
LKKDWSKKEACGVFGIRALDGRDVSKMIFNGLITLQHRGQEASGISTLNENHIHLRKSLGLVNASYSEKTLGNLKGSMGIGHVRYSTVGSSTITDAQPFKRDYPRKGLVVAHNGNLVNYIDMRNILMKEGRNFESTCDAEIIANKLADELVKTKDIEKSIYNYMEAAEGSYSAGMFTGERELIAFRDPNGIRPFSFGVNDKLAIFASESVALNINGIDETHDVKPGEMVLFGEDGKIERKVLMKGERKHCMFEYVYFSRPDSVIEGKWVYDVRIELGRSLAKTYSSEADVIVPIPDTSRSAAEGIARETGIHVAEGLMKNRYIYRTFIMPEQRTRALSVDMKLNPVKSVLKDKHVLLVDDSIVRGTTTRKIAEMVRKAGAKKIDLWITCPPVVSPCFYGIDIATHNELIAFKHKVEEIQKITNVDRLCYQTIDGLVKSIGLGENICKACLTGEYPTCMAQKIADRMKTQKNLEQKRYYEIAHKC